MKKIGGRWFTEKNKAIEQETQTCKRMGAQWRLQRQMTPETCAFGTASQRPTSEDPDD